jgi:hypothetical protein
MSYLVSSRNRFWSHEVKSPEKQDQQLYTIIERVEEGYGIVNII